MHPDTDTVDCQVKNVVYDVKCLECGDNALSVYSGMSLRSWGERSWEHLDGYRKRKVGNPLWKHHQESHSDRVEELPWNMKVVRRHTTCFSRTCHEVVRISRLANQSNVNLLNSKSEYNQRVSVPRLGLPQTQFSEVNMNVRGHGVSNVGKEWDPGAGQDSQDSISAGLDGVPSVGGGGDQTNLQPPVKKKRKLDDNDFDGGRKAVLAHYFNRTQSRERDDSGNRTFSKPKRRLNNRRTDRK